MTICIATSRFTENIQSGDHMKNAVNIFLGNRPTAIAQLRDKFNELVKLIHATNGVWSPLIFCFLLHTAAWYSTWIGQ